MEGVDDLRRFIEEDLAKERAVMLATNASNPKELAAALWDFVLLNEQPVSWRAMWFLEHLAAQNKELLRPYLEAIIFEFPNYKFDGQKRSALKILQMFPLTEYDYGSLLNICFDLLLSNSESIAVRSFAMQIIFDISQLEPEIKPELKESILHILPEAPKGVQSKARKLLQLLEIKNLKV